MSAVLSDEIPPSEQIELLGPNDYPERPDLVDLVKSRSFLRRGRRWKRYVHSGKIAFKELRTDSDRCEAICASLLVGMSARLIGRRFGLSPRTVALIRTAMEERGELAPIRGRVLRLLDEIVERGLERYRDAIDNDEVSPSQLPIPLAALIDKKGQLEAGVVPGTERTEGEVWESQVRVAWSAYQRARKAAGALPAESASIDSAPQLAATTGPTADAVLLDTTLDTTGEPVELAPMAPGGSQGGGGVARGARPAEGDETGPTNFKTKGSG